MPKIIKYILAVAILSYSTFLLAHPDFGWQGGVVVLKGPVKLVTYVNGATDASIKGEIVSASPQIIKLTTPANNPFSLTPGVHSITATLGAGNPLNVKNCDDAVVAVSAGDGNFIEGRVRGGVGVFPRVLSFICVVDTDFTSP